MKKTALALASALLLLAACDTNSSDDAANGGNGMNGRNGVGQGGGVLGTVNGVDVGDRVLFETDSSVINADGQAVLTRQVEWLKSHDSVNVLVEGHADERGTREYNLALGERRATAAKNFLISSGVAGNRVSTTSFGKERPAVLGNDESAWGQNRRAVTVIAN